MPARPCVMVFRGAAPSRPPVISSIARTRPRQVSRGFSLSPRRYHRSWVTCRF